MMTRTFKVLSLLLTYPTAELQEAVTDMAAALEAEGLLPARQRRALDGLFHDLASRDLYDLQ